MTSTGTRATARVVEVGESRVRATGSTSRACADVDGAEIFFESEDLPLSAPPELFATALVPAVAQRRWKLRIADPLDRRWLDGVRDRARRVREREARAA
jgi:hypothetical protein